MTQEACEHVQKRLFYPYEPDGTSLFAVLDAARDARIYGALRRSGLAYECLFSGQLAPALREAAPYVVHLLPEHALTDYLVREGWGRAWGIYVAMQGGLPAVRRHLRTLLRVRTEGGKKLFFRYYDPRVLRIFLPTCDAGQLGQMFGPLYRFDVETEAHDLLRFRAIASGAGAKLRSWTHVLGGGTHASARDE